MGDEFGVICDHCGREFAADHIKPVAVVARDGRPLVVCQGECEEFCTGAEANYQDRIAMGYRILTTQLDHCLRELGKLAMSAGSDHTRYVARKAIDRVYEIKEEIREEVGLPA